MPGTSYRPLVSVILPTYNEESDIAPTMEALAALTYTPLEVVVVDDASRDRTVEVIEAYRDRVSSLTILPQPTNRGVAASRNVALKVARGEIVILLNADVQLPPDFIEQILPHYQAGADYLVINSSAINQGRPFGRYLQAQHEWALYRALDEQDWSEGYSCRREAALAVGGFPEEFPGASGEDAVFGDRMRARFKRAADYTIVVPHIVPDDWAGYWSQRRGRGRGGAYRLFAYDKLPIRWGSVLRSVLGTWFLALTLVSPVVYVARLMPYSKRGWVDFPAFVWARIVEMLATAVGYWRGAREIAARRA